MNNSLAARLRIGAQQVLDPRLSTRRRRASRRRRWEARRALSATRDRDRRDRLIAQSLVGYRRGPKDFWGPLLLELLAPKLSIQVSRLSTVVPYIDCEDVAPQLIAELLTVSATMPLPANSRRWERALRLRAKTHLTRWMAREERRQLRSVSLEALEPEDEDAGSGDE
jgi:hypothetical protein